MNETRNIPSIGLPLLALGETREVYGLDNKHLAIVTSDRISAHGVVMKEPVSNKGRVITAMTSYWMNELVDIAPNNEVPIDTVELPRAARHPYFLGRLAVAKRAEMLPIDCTVLGNLTGSAFEQYKKSTKNPPHIHHMPAPKDMRESEAFYKPMFTPSIRAERSRPAENISFTRAVNLVGREAAEKARDISVQAFDLIYARGLEKGIIVAESKFKLGYIDGELAICDEVGTPDSSIFWDVNGVKPGITPPSYNKQILHDYFKEVDWNKEPPAPYVPERITRGTSQRYQLAYEKLTGKKLKAWPGKDSLLSPSQGDDV